MMMQLREMSRREIWSVSIYYLRANSCVNNAEGGSYPSDYFMVQHCMVMTFLYYLQMLQQVTYK